MPTEGIVMVGRKESHVLPLGVAKGKKYQKEMKGAASNAKRKKIKTNYRDV